MKDNQKTDFKKVKKVVLSTNNLLQIKTAERYIELYNKKYSKQLTDWDKDINKNSLMTFLKRKFNMI